MSEERIEGGVRENLHRSQCTCISRVKPNIHVHVHVAAACIYIL